MFEYVRHTESLHKLYSNLDKIITDGKFQNRRYVMFGTSRFAGMIIYYLQLHNVQVEAIIDNDEKDRD